MDYKVYKVYKIVEKIIIIIAHHKFHTTTLAFIVRNKTKLF